MVLLIITRLFTVYYVCYVQCSPRGRRREGIMLDSFSSVLCMYCTVYSGVPGVDGEKVSGWTVFLTVYCVSTVQCSPRGRWREGIRLDSVFTV